jgi:hypothetical protein
MDQTEFVLGPVAVRNVKTWEAEVAALTGSEAFEAAGSGTLAGQFSESRRIVQ